MRIINVFKPAAWLLLALGIFAGCESTDGGGSYNTTNYYGSGWYGNPYYYDYDDHHDHNGPVAPPPDSQPGRPGGPRPSHPIANPPGVSRPSPRPMPSIPTAPRAAGRSGGGRR